MSTQDIADVKIVATIGPASRDRQTLTAMIEAGMNVARLNFSHGSHEEHRQLITQLRELQVEMGRVVGILADLAGPKLRIGELAPGDHHLEAGAPFLLVAQPVEGDATQASLNLPVLLDELRPGEEVLLDDGLIRMEVEEVRGDGVLCRVVHGGLLRPRKGVNLPQTRASLPSLTEQDIEDLAFALEQRVDFIALSFVRTPANVMDLKRRIRDAGHDVPVIAKLEKPQAIERLEDILDVSAGVMVARGDLGVEMPPEELPHIQKQVIKAANAFNKPVITATQMLESMVHHPRPTRAEASDVANAILDGTDAVMLSAESAVGAYPVRSIQMMDKIIRSARRRRSDARNRSRRSVHPRAIGEPFTRAIARAALDAAIDTDARAVVVHTLSGTTAAVMSKFQPPAEIIAFTPNRWALGRMTLQRGVRPCLISEELAHTDALIYEVERYLIEHGIAAIDDAIVILSSAPIDRRGPTNLMKLHQIAG